MALGSELQLPDLAEIKRVSDEAGNEFSKLYRDFCKLIFETEGEAFIARYYLRFHIPITTRFGNSYIDEFYNEFLSFKMSSQSKKVYELQKDLIHTIDSIKNELEEIDQKQQETKNKLYSFIFGFISISAALILVIGGGYLGWTLSEDTFILFKLIFAIVGVFCGIVVLPQILEQIDRISDEKKKTNTTRVSGFAETYNWYWSEANEGNKLINAAIDQKEYLIKEILKQWRENLSNSVENTIRNEITTVKSIRQEILNNY